MHNVIFFLLQPENIPKTTARNEKSSWSYPINCSPRDLPSSIYLEDGEEKYLSSSSTKQRKPKKKDGYGGEKKLGEYLLNCGDEGTKTLCDAAVADDDDLQLLNLNKLSMDCKKFRESSDDNDDDTAVNYMQQNETNDERRKTEEKTFSSAKNQARIIPRRWPGEYSSIVTAPPNRTVTVLSRANVNNASPSSTSILDDDRRRKSSSSSRTRGQKCKQQQYKNLHNSSAVNFFCPSAVLKSCMASSSSSSSLCCSSTSTSVAGYSATDNNNDNRYNNCNVKNSLRSLSSSYCDSRRERFLSTTPTKKCSSSSYSNDFSHEHCNSLNEPLSSWACAENRRRSAEDEPIIGPSTSSAPAHIETFLDVNYSSSDNKFDRRPSEKASVADGNGPSAVINKTTTNFRRS